MKIKFKGDFSDIKSEGLNKIVKILTEKLVLKISGNFSDNTLAHIHSGGFFPAIKYRKESRQSIYTLYSNLDFQPFSKLRNLLEHYLFYTSADTIQKKKMIVRLIFSLASSFIPLIVKRYFLSKFKKVIVPTEYLKSKLDLDNCIVIPFGINITKFKPIKRKSSSRLIVAYFGHRGTERGIPDILIAFETLLDVRIEKRIYLTLPCSVIQKRMENVSGVKIFGQVDNIKLAYCDCDIVVLPYRTTSATIGIPLVLIEAMACEKTIITTPLPHIKEICGDTVIYVNTYSPKEIVNAIEKLKLNPGFRTRLGQSARARIVKKYSEKKMIDAYLNLYSTLVNGKLS